MATAPWRSEVRIRLGLAYLIAAILLLPIAGLLAVCSTGGLSLAGQVRKLDLLEVGGDPPLVERYPARKAAGAGRIIALDRCGLFLLERMAARARRERRAHAFPVTP